MATEVRYAQRSGLDTRLVDGEAFVITQTTIKHLNPAATLIWLSLETPASHGEITAVLQDFFPVIPRRQLSADLSRTLRELRRSGIVITDQ